MARYIDTRKVTVPSGFFNKNLGVPDLLKWLEAQPTADVVPVVRCKDCEHYDKGGCKHFGYHTYTPDVDEDDFCSYGRRKDEISKATDS